MSSPHGIAIVTGASQGIGRAIALRLADDGFDVAVNDLPSAQATLETIAQDIKGKGKRSYIAVGDVSVEADVQNMISNVVRELGGIDVMVANAGICYPRTIVDTTLGEWDHLFSVNARGVFLCYKYAAIQMIQQGRGGRIIGASSCAGQSGELRLAAYGATKFAVRGLTQSAAREWGHHKITVNCYCPGAIETSMLESIGTAAGSVDQFYERTRSLSAVGYNGTPAEVASLVSYLSSKEAHFITGQSLGVNGGRVLT